MPSDPPLRDSRSKQGKMIAELNGIRRESVITSLLLIVVIVTFVWAFWPWQRHETSSVAVSRAAVRAAESFGFTEVRITKTRHTGGALSPCDENDGIVHEAVATNPRGKEVPILICCNSTNNCTIKTR